MGDHEDEIVHLSIERGVATITLDSPENRNALSRRLLGELDSALDRAEADGVRAVVLTHAGPTFCAGADLKERAQEPSGGGASGPSMVTVLRRLAEGPIPTIAAVHGTVRAGGIGLMASCDLVVVASGTTFAFTEVRIGVVPAIISVPILARVNASLLRAPFLTGEAFGAEEARSMGLVTHVADDVAATVARLTDGILHGAPAAVAGTKALLSLVPTLSRDDAWAQMERRSLEFFASPDATEGMAAFREKRRPSWQVEAFGDR
jgi:enoyl-CoA hydratase/carnithine racemase